MRTRTLATFCAVLLLPTAGCTGESEATAGGGEAGSASSVAPPPIAAAPAAAGGEAAERLFERSQVQGEGCVLLDAATVADAVGIQSAQVTANPRVGCLFSWADGGVIVTPRVHRTVEGARQHFASFSQDVTADEMRGGKQELQQRLDAAAAEGELEERDATVGGALAASAPEQEFTHRRLELGNEATVDSRGKVMVRVGNVTFDVAAKHGGDEIDPVLSQELARRVVAKLDRL